MQEIQNVRAYTVNSAQPSFKGAKENAVTAPEQKVDGDDKLKNALVALGALGAAGVGIYALNKTGKLDKIKERLGAAKQAVTNAVRKPTKAQNAVTNGYNKMDVSQRVEVAKDKIEKGATNNSLKNGGITTNLTHTEKAPVKQAMKEAHSVKMAKQQKEVKTAIDTVKKVERNAGEVENSFQAMNNNVGKIPATQQKATDAAKNAREVADEFKEKASTRREQLRARQMENKAIEAEQAAKKTTDTANKILSEFAQQDNAEVAERFSEKIARVRAGENVRPNEILEALDKNKKNLTPETYSGFRTELKTLVKNYRRTVK